MPIIINEFEIVPAGASQNGQGASTVAEQNQAENPPAQSPVLEAERIMRHHALRQARVWAH